MKLNIKKATAALAPTVAYLSLVGSAAATTTPINLCDPSNSSFNQFAKLCNTGSASIGNVIMSVIVILFIIAVIVALIFLIWGGLKWIFSGGDKTAVESARNTIIAAVIGLVIVFASFFLLNLVTQILLGAPITSVNLPTIF